MPYKASGPTIRDIAREVGVSHVTVSRAFRDKTDISQATRDRIRQAAEQLGYRPNHAARSLAEARTRTVGLVIQPNLFFVDVLFGAEGAAQERDYGIIQTVPGDNTAALREHVETLRARRVDGLIFLSGSEWREHDYLRELHEEGVPIVTINRYCPGMGFARIFFDFRGSTRAVVRRLLAAGHRSVLFIGGTPDHPQESVRERLAGYREGVREAGAWNAAAEAFGGWGLADGEELTRAALRACPEATAMVVINDHTGAGALRALRRLGRRVPEEMAVVSLHGTEIAHCTDPALTTVRHPIREAGEIACRLLIERFQEPDRDADTLILPSSFAVRESCGLSRGQGNAKVLPLE